LSKQEVLGEKEASVHHQEDGYHQGKWSEEEHNKFLEGLMKFGKNWN